MEHFLHPNHPLFHDLNRKLDQIMADVTNLTTTVQALTTEVDVAVTALHNGSTPTQSEVDNLTTTVQAAIDSLKAAIPA